MPKNYREGLALYKEATGSDWQAEPGETGRDTAFRLHGWCKWYISENHRGNEAVKNPPAI